MSKIKIMIECDDQDEALSVMKVLTGADDEDSTVSEKPKNDKPKQEKPKEEKPKEEKSVSDIDADDAVVDSDGMPYDASVHSSTRAVNADGTWKALRGKADAAKAARAAFKASGGSVSAPVETEDNGLPGVKADDTPELPGADVIPTAQPITMAEFTAKATAVLASKKIDDAGIVQVYLDATGQTNAKSAAKSLGTNESMRRAAFDRLTEIENA